jgi:flagellar biogenesis protein FliO
MLSLAIYVLAALGAQGAAAPAKAEATGAASTASSTAKVDAASPAPLPDGGALWPGRKIVPDAIDDTLPSAALTDSEKKAAAEAALARLEGEERSWTGQLVRTILSLLLVIGLIYLVFKVVVPRLMGVSLPVRGTKSLRVVERTQIDARHAVVLIEIDKQRFLVGTGEHGIQLLADLSRPGAAAATDKNGFAAALERATGASADGDTHAKG